MSLRHDTRSATPETATPDRDATPDELALAALRGFGEGALVGPLGRVALQAALGNGGLLDLGSEEDAPAAGPTALLTDGGLLDRVSETEATLAVDMLLALTDNDRIDALGRLGPDQLDAMIAGLPAARWADLGELSGAAPDPDQQIRLWAAFHKGKADAALSSGREDVDWWDRSEDAALARHRNDVRDQTIADNATEIDAEVAALLASGDVSQEAVDALMGRRGLELDVELRHGVNLTSAKPGQGGFLAPPTDIQDRAARTWDIGALTDLDGTLGALGPDKVRDNRALSEIKRTGAPEVGRHSGDATWLEDGVLNVADAALAFNPEDYEEGEEPGPSALQRGVTGLLAGAWAAGDGRARAEMEAAADWEHLDRDAAVARLRAAGGLDTEIDPVLDGQRTEPLVVDGIAYRPDGAGGVLAVPCGDRAGVQATDPEGQLAELVTRATLEPKALYHDLIKAPMGRVSELEDQLREAKFWRDELEEVEGEGLRRAADREAVVREHLARARRVAADLRQQWALASRYAGAPAAGI